MKRLLKLSFACFCCYWLLLLPSHPPPTSASLIYTSRNECVSHDTYYEIKFGKKHFEIHETISFTVLSPVKNCYFFAEDFILNKVEMTRGEVSVQISVHELGNRNIAVQMLDGAFLLPKYNYKVYFMASKLIAAVEEGLVIKTYRNLTTMKMAWYAIVKIGPGNCGKVYICINSLRSVQTLTIVAVHPSTHKLLCPGEIKPLPLHPYDGDGSLRTECRSLNPVAVNNMHFSVAEFRTLDYDGVKDNLSPHRFSFVAPTNEKGHIYYDLVQQCEIVKMIFSMLLLTVNIKPFHVFLYALPNTDIPRPIIRSGVCYFNFDNVHFQYDLEVLYRAYLRCLLHQGFLNERKSDSWSLHYAAEGLFERLLSEYEVYKTKITSFRDIIEGDNDDLAALAKIEDDVTDIRSKRPWRKAAGFFSTLGTISPNYAGITYQTFLNNNATVVETTYETYLEWLTEYSPKLGLKIGEFLEVIDTWTSVQGYPVITAQVLVNKTVCVDHYNVGTYFRSFKLPFQVDFNFPITVHSQTKWTNPRAETSCVTVATNLYPYLINSYFNMVCRVFYDTMNWRVWADQLMLVKVRKGLGPMRKVALVTDALYFAGERKLSYKIALRFLFGMQDEESEEAWRMFDKTLRFLDARIRYTGVYSLFRKTIREVSERYYNASMLIPIKTSEIAYKWSCMMGNAYCLQESEAEVDSTLMNHMFRKRPEVLCAGMRRLKLKRFHQMINTMDRPDWREPEFYVQMMLCAEDRKILRELMHHIFFRNSWKLRPKKITEMMITMIRASRPGSDMAFYYLNHDPEGMVKILGFKNMLTVIDELVLYRTENNWFLLFIRRMKRKSIISAELNSRKKDILQSLKNNKAWYNTQYKDIARFFMHDYGWYLRKFEWDEPEERGWEGIPINLKY